MSKYRIVVSPSREGEGFVARTAEIPTCLAMGATRGEAVAKLEEELVAQLQNMREEGITPPPPLDETEFDGKLSVKVTPELHRELAFMAREANVELEALLLELLARRPDWRVRSRGRNTEGRGNHRQRGPSGQRYHEIMDNPADFREYLRSLDGPKSGRGGGRKRRER